jgi:large subunit ribosomal protein L15
MGLKVKKRTKVRRYRGSKGHGGGFRQKRRGKGNKGGKGMSGTGKRSSQKMQSGIILARQHGFEKYFGRQGYTSRSTYKKPNEVMNLDDIQKVYAGQKEIRLEGYKILGEGEGFAATIHARTASQSAIDKMTKAGGKIITLAGADEGKVAQKDSPEGKGQKKK